MSIKSYLSFADSLLGSPITLARWQTKHGTPSIGQAKLTRRRTPCGTALHWQHAPEKPPVRRHWPRTQAVYTGQRGLQFWEAMSRVFVAWGTFATGDPAGAVDVLPVLIETAETTGGGLFGALSRAVLAEAQAATGSALAFETIAQAEALARRSGAFYGLAEIQRREGVIVRHLWPDDLMGAEAAFRRSLATAREQGARFWELRTACDLARLMTEQGRRTEAQHSEPLYGWFTEGFETTVLVEARTQLIGLRSGQF